MLRVWCALAVCGVAAAQTQALPPLTLSERAGIYARATAGPGSLLSAAASAGLDQWRNVPPEWRQGPAGYGRRFGYGLAESAASNTIEFGVSALRGEDTRYVRSGHGSFWARTRYVILHTYLVPGRDGSTTFAASRIVGAYGSAAIANVWYPSRLVGSGETLLRGTWSLTADMGNSAFLEFWPDIKRTLFRQKK